MFHSELCCRGRAKLYGRLHRCQEKSDRNAASRDLLAGRSCSTVVRIPRRPPLRPVRHERDGCSSQELELCSKAIRWPCESCCQDGLAEHGARRRKRCGCDSRVILYTRWPVLNKRREEYCRPKEQQKIVRVP